MNERKEEKKEKSLLHYDMERKKCKKERTIIQKKEQRKRKKKERNKKQKKTERNVSKSMMNQRGRFRTELHATLNESLMKIKKTKRKKGVNKTNTSL